MKVSELVWHKPQYIVDSDPECTFAYAKRNGEMREIMRYSDDRYDVILYSGNDWQHEEQNLDRLQLACWLVDAVSVKHIPKVARVKVSDED